jgi:hypothetical protein
VNVKEGETIYFYDIVYISFFCGVTKKKIKEVKTVSSRAFINDEHEQKK